MFSPSCSFCDDQGQVVEQGDLPGRYICGGDAQTLGADRNHSFAGRPLKVRVRILEVRHAARDDQLHLTSSSPAPMH